VILLLAVALVGFVYSYLYVSKPQLIPPQLRLASLRQPQTILFLGVDVVYNPQVRGNVKIDRDAFTGRSDTILIGRLDPQLNTLRVLALPRDTQVRVPGYGTQKINAANAIGGPNLALSTVSNFLQMPIDHFVVLNVHGLVDLVDELGGITVEVPKRMQYMDWTAKLKIDIEPGVHTLTGNQAMGFVRFRHDALGDIGRVQRQEIFLRAVLDKALKPDSWSHLPKLLEIAQRYICTDLSVEEMMKMANFVRGVPKSNQVLTMMPGRFSPSGDWQVERSDISKMVARLNGANFVEEDKRNMRVVVQNSSSTKGMGYKVANLLNLKGYRNVQVQGSSLDLECGVKRTRIVAQKANPEDARLVRNDLGDIGDMVNASVGDIDSSVTVVVGDDLAQIIESSNSSVNSIGSREAATRAGLQEQVSH
ncbi:MAG: LCP family protein, partial [Cyanobacteria bacterium SZAS LIN-2]|nr:LCP family protein [Cyanobacteria bacterium SZAS LIN-2]